MKNEPSEMSDEPGVNQQFKDGVWSALPVALTDDVGWSRISASKCQCLERAEHDHDMRVGKEQE